MTTGSASATVNITSIDGVSGTATVTTETPNSFAVAQTINISGNSYSTDIVTITGGMSGSTPASGVSTFTTAEAAPYVVGSVVSIVAGGTEYQILEAQGGTPSFGNVQITTTTALGGDITTGTVMTITGIPQLGGTITQATSVAGTPGTITVITDGEHQLIDGDTVSTLLVGANGNLTQVTTADGLTATATTASPHGLISGETVLIFDITNQSGTVIQTEKNGNAITIYLNAAPSPALAPGDTINITGNGANSGVYAIVGESASTVYTAEVPGSSNTGTTTSGGNVNYISVTSPGNEFEGALATYQLTDASGLSQTQPTTVSITAPATTGNVISVVESGGTITVTTASPHGLLGPQTFYEAHGTTSVEESVNLNVPSHTIALSGVSGNGTLATASSVSTHNLFPGDQINVSGVVVGSSTPIALATQNAAAAIGLTASGSNLNQTAAGPMSIANITSNSAGYITVTLNNPVNAGLLVGDWVTLTGVTNSGTNVNVTNAIVSFVATTTDVITFRIVIAGITLNHPASWYNVTSATATFPRVWVTTNQAITGIATGGTITVAGSNISAYNGTKGNVHVVGSNQLFWPGAASGNNTATVSVYPGSSDSNPPYITPAWSNGGPITFTTASPHSFTTGEQINISGLTLFYLGASQGLTQPAVAEITGDGVNTCYLTTYSNGYGMGIGSSFYISTYDQLSSGSTVGSAFDGGVGWSGPKFTVIGVSGNGLTYEFNCPGGPSYSATQAELEGTCLYNASSGFNTRPGQALTISSVTSTTFVTNNPNETQSASSAAGSPIVTSSGIENDVVYGGIATPTAVLANPFDGIFTVAATPGSQTFTYIMATSTNGSGTGGTAIQPSVYSDLTDLEIASAPTTTTFTCPAPSQITGTGAAFYGTSGSPAGTWSQPTEFGGNVILTYVQTNYNGASIDSYDFEASTNGSGSVFGGTWSPIAGSGGTTITITGGAWNTPTGFNTPIGGGFNVAQGGGVVVTVPSGSLNTFQYSLTGIPTAPTASTVISGCDDAFWASTSTGMSAQNVPCTIISPTSFSYQINVSVAGTLANGTWSSAVGFNVNTASITVNGADTFYYANSAVGTKFGTSDSEAIIASDPFNNPSATIVAVYSGGTSFAYTNGGTGSVSGGTVTGSTGYNGAVTVVSIIDPSDFTFTYTTAVSGTGTGGVATSAPIGGTLPGGGSPTGVVGTGVGTMVASVSSVGISEPMLTIYFTYTADINGLVNGIVTLQVPNGWSTPTTNTIFSSSAHVDAADGSGNPIGTVTCNIYTGIIEVTNLNLGPGDVMVITYGDNLAGATSPAFAGPQTWLCEEQSTATGTLSALASGSPVIVVGTAADGSGTCTVVPNEVGVSSTNNTLSFYYTAVGGGLNDGEITISVPAAWSFPAADPDATAPGYVTAVIPTAIDIIPGPGTNPIVAVGGTDSGGLSDGDAYIDITNITLAGGESIIITYGSTTGYVLGDGGGATAPGSPITQTWTVEERSSSEGTLTAIAVQPTVTVGTAPPADGSGTMTANISQAYSSSPHNTIIFTFLATHNMIDGEITLVVPSGWDPPSLTGTDNGFVQATYGVPPDEAYVTALSPPWTLSVASSTITIGSINLSAGDYFQLGYGVTLGGGVGATAPATLGDQTWQVQEESSSGGTLTDIVNSPVITIVAANDGEGTMTVSPNRVIVSSTNNTFAFSFNAATGGVADGEVTLAVPSDWPAPSLTGTDPGYVTATGGTTVAVSGQLIEVSALTLLGGDSITITYGDQTSGGPGVTAPATAEVQTWTTQEMSTSAGTLTNLSLSPSITVGFGFDGSGTMTTPTKSVEPSSTGNVITFTYTAASGGLDSGILALIVPSGWSMPSITSTDSGYVTSSTGTVGVNGSVIQVTGVTLSPGNTLTLIYGVQSLGGSGAVAPPTAVGSQTWLTQEASEASGTLTNLAVSPSIYVGTLGAGGAPVGSVYSVIPTPEAVGLGADTSTLMALDGNTPAASIQTLLPDYVTADATSITYDSETTLTTVVFATPVSGFMVGQSVFTANGGNLGVIGTISSPTQFITSNGDGTYFPSVSDQQPTLTINAGTLTPITPFTIGPTANGNIYTAHFTAPPYSGDTTYTFSGTIPSSDFGPTATDYIINDLVPSDATSSIFSIQVGMPVFGSGLASDTFVTSVDGTSNSVALSQQPLYIPTPPTTTGNTSPINGQLIVVDYGALVDGFYAGMTVTQTTGSAIPANTVVTDVYPSVSFAGNFTSTSATVTNVTSIDGLVVGMGISTGDDTIPGSPTYTYITDIDPNSMTITMNQPATATVASEPIEAWPALQTNNTTTIATVSDITGSNVYVFNQSPIYSLVKITNYGGIDTIVFSGDTIINTPYIGNIDDTSSLYVGLALSGYGISPTSTITFVGDNYVTMNHGALSTNTAATISAYPPNSRLAEFISLSNSTTVGTGTVTAPLPLVPVASPDGTTYGLAKGRMALFTTEACASIISTYTMPSGGYPLQPLAGLIHPGTAITAITPNVQNGAVYGYKLTLNKPLLGTSPDTGRVIVASFSYNGLYPTVMTVNSTANFVLGNLITFRNEIFQVLAIASPTQLYVGYPLPDGTSIPVTNEYVSSFVGTVALGSTLINVVDVLDSSGAVMSGTQGLVTGMIVSSADSPSPGITYPNSITPTYADGVLPVNTQIIGAGENPAQVVLSQPAAASATNAVFNITYPNGDNPNFIYAFENGITTGTLVAPNLSTSPTTQVSGWGVATVDHGAAVPHVAQTAVGSYTNSGVRYFGSQSAGDLEGVPLSLLGSLTGTTLDLAVKANDTQFVVNPAPTSNTATGAGFVPLWPSFSATIAPVFPATVWTDLQGAFGVLSLPNGEINPTPDALAVGTSVGSPIVFTGSITAGDNTVTVLSQSDASQLSNGMYVIGDGIPDNSIITALEMTTLAGSGYIVNAFQLLQLNTPDAAEAESGQVFPNATITNANASLTASWFPLNTVVTSVIETSFTGNYSAGQAITAVTNLIPDGNGNDAVQYTVASTAGMAVGDVVTIVGVKGGGIPLGNDDYSCATCFQGLSGNFIIDEIVDATDFAVANMWTTLNDDPAVLDNAYVLSPQITGITDATQLVAGLGIWGSGVAPGTTITAVVYDSTTSTWTAQLSLPFVSASSGTAFQAQGYVVSAAPSYLPWSGTAVITTDAPPRLEDLVTNFSPIQQTIPGGTSPTSIALVSTPSTGAPIFGVGLTAAGASAIPFGVTVQDVVGQSNTAWISSSDPGIYYELDATSTVLQNITSGNFVLGINLVAENLLTVNPPALNSNGSPQASGVLGAVGLAVSAPIYGILTGQNIPVAVGTVTALGYDEGGSVSTIVLDTAYAGASEGSGTFYSSAYGVVVVGEGADTESVLLSGPLDYQLLNPSSTGAPPAVLWTLADGSAFVYDHSVGEPVVTPNVFSAGSS